MKKVEILSGNFTAAGNYSAYDDESQRYFVPGRLMKAHAWEKDEDVKLPFHAKVDIRQIGQLDENGEPILKDDVPVLVDRPQVLSIFKSREEIIEHEIKKVGIDLEIASGITRQAKALDLNDTAIKALISAVI